MLRPVQRGGQDTGERATSRVPTKAYRSFQDAGLPGSHDKGHEAREEEPGGCSDPRCAFWKRDDSQCLFTAEHAEYAENTREPDLGLKPYPRISSASANSAPLR